MAWRAMKSLLTLRDQVNLIAPNRSKASDGLVGDENHETTSGHYPHYVAGVGSEIVTAWDCTNDPVKGCDTWVLADTLRQHRDKRIRYVISNQKIFSSYASGSRAAWTWGPYSGSNPHKGHCHIQVLDDKISDTTTPWNLEGFDMALSQDDVNRIVAGVWNSLRTSNPDATAWQALITGKLTRDNALYWWLKGIATGDIPTSGPSGFDWTKMIEAPFPGLVQLGKSLDALAIQVRQLSDKVDDMAPGIVPPVLQVTLNATGTLETVEPATNETTATIEVGQ